MPWWKDDTDARAIAGAWEMKERIAHLLAEVTARLDEATWLSRALQTEGMLDSRRPDPFAVWCVEHLGPLVEKQHRAMAAYLEDPDRGAPWRDPAGGSAYFRRTHVFPVPVDTQIIDGISLATDFDQLRALLRQTRDPAAS